MSEIKRIEALEEITKRQYKKISEMEKQLSIAGKLISDLQNKVQQLRDAVVLGEFPKF